MKTIQTILAAAVMMTTAGGAMARCHDVVRYHRCEVRDDHRVIGTVAGAVIGGAIGHQIGGGKGKDLATVGGAVAGGYAGNQIQKHHQNRRCRTVERVCD